MIENDIVLTISHIDTRAVTIRRERTAVYRGTATLYRGTYRDILQNMYLWRKQQNNKFYKLY